MGYGAQNNWPHWQSDAIIENFHLEMQKTLISPLSFCPPGSVKRSRIVPITSFEGFGLLFSSQHQINSKN